MFVIAWLLLVPYTLWQLNYYQFLDGFCKGRRGVRSSVSAGWGKEQATAAVLYQGQNLYFEYRN